jgi:hypothetical protein
MGTINFPNLVKFLIVSTVHSPQVFGATDS